MKIVNATYDKEIYPFEFYCSRKELLAFANYCKLTNQFENIYWGNFLENSFKPELESGYFPLNNHEVKIAREFIKIYHD